MVRSVLVIITLVDQQLDGFHLNLGGRFKRLFYSFSNNHNYLNKKKAVSNDTAPYIIMYVIGYILSAFSLDTAKPVLSKS